MEIIFNKIESKVYKDPITLAEIFPHEVDGILCPYVIHDSIIGKQFSGHVLIVKDIDFSINCLRALKNNTITDSEFRTAILFSGLFTYMKCFTSGKERGTHLHESLFKTTLPKFINIHKEIDEFRDQYLAHASTKIHETSNIVLFLNPDVKNKKLIKMSIAAKYVTDKDEKLDEYIELMEKVKNLVTARMEGRLAALKKEVYEINLDELYDKSILPDKSKFLDIKLGKYKEKENGI